VEEEAFSGLALGVPRLRFQLGSLSLETVGIQETGSQFDLTLRAAAIGGGLFCSLLYNPIFERETISQLARHYRNVLEEATARPAQLVSQISVLSTEEREQLVRDWSNGEEPDHHLIGVHVLVERQALQVPDAIALICGEQHLSYGELNHQADHFARLLRRKQIRTESRVAICLGRRSEMAVAMLAALKAGAAYVPIDPDYPLDRQQFMLRDSGAQLLITEKGKEELASVGMPVLIVEEIVEVRMN